MNNFITEMNEKGKITIPETIRKQENYKAGQKFSFLKSIDGLILIPIMSEKQIEDKLIPINIIQNVSEELDEIELEIESDLN